MNPISRKSVKNHPFKLSPLVAGIVLSLGVVVSGCQDSKVVSASNNSVEAVKKVEQAAEVNHAQLAKEIAKKYIITDGHIDVPYRLEDEFENVAEHTAHGDFDFPRAVAGGLDAPFMSIYIPARLEQSGGSKELADKLITMVEDIVKAAPEKFALAHSTADVEANFAKGIMRNKLL